MNTAQRQHLAAEGAASKAGRQFSVLPLMLAAHRPPATAHLEAWRKQRIEEVLTNYINTYSLQARELAGGPL